MSDQRRIGLAGLVSALLGGLLAYVLWRSHSTPPHGTPVLPPLGGVRELLQVVAGLAGVLIGFLASAKSILLTVMDRPSLQGLTSAPGGGWSDLMDSILRAIDIGIGLFLVSALALLVVDACPRSWLPIGAAAWFGLTGAAVASFRVVVGHIFWVIEEARKPKP